jgi:hypothetical protein
MTKIFAIPFEVTDCQSKGFIHGNFESLKLWSWQLSSFNHKFLYIYYGDANVMCRCKYHQWRRQPFKCGGYFRAVKTRDTSMGIRGYATPENFWNLESLKYDFLHFQGKIIQNSEDYKVKKHTIFS